MKDQARPVLLYWVIPTSKQSCATFPVFKIVIWLYFSCWAFTTFLSLFAGHLERLACFQFPFSFQLKPLWAGFPSNGLWKLLTSRWPLTSKVLSSVVNSPSPSYLACQLHLTPVSHSLGFPGLWSLTMFFLFYWRFFLSFLYLFLVFVNSSSGAAPGSVIVPLCPYKFISLMISPHMRL